MAVSDQLITGNYSIYNGDFLAVAPTFPDGCVHLSLYSPPFGGMLYQYSSDPADLSNSKDYQEFFDHYDYFVREIHRLTALGRMTAVHCQDIAVAKGDDHHILDFPGDVTRAHVRCRKDGCSAPPFERDRGMCGHGWWRQVATYFVWKEPLTVRNRTMVKSLHHKTMCEDSTKCSMANADQLIIFRRSGKNAVPVAHPVGLTRYAGSNQPPDNVLKWRGYKGDQTKNAYSQWCWRQYASAFWNDVRIDRTLGSGASLYSANRADKDESDEKHMHPLQLDVIERAVVMWSNPGEVVLTPCMGVGSEVYGSVLNGRKAIGVELKGAYYRQSVENLKDVKPEDDAAHADQREFSFGFDAPTPAAESPTAVAVETPPRKPKRQRKKKDPSAEATLAQELLAKSRPYPEDFPGEHEAASPSGGPVREALTRAGAKDGVANPPDADPEYAALSDAQVAALVACGNRRAASERDRRVSPVPATKADPS